MEYREISGKVFLEPKSNKQQILCVGQVQSGKTKFIIKETEDAIKSGIYDCVIIIGGTNNILLNQTEKRFKQNKNIKNYTHINLSKGHNISNLTLRNNKVILYTLKGDVALRKVSKFVDYNSEFKYLIIDDESDYGSLDVSKDDSRSTIYNHILNIYNSAWDATYYSVTATPFANILSDSWKFNSVRYVKPGEKYCGIDFFFENNKYETCEDLYIEDKINEDRLMKILIDHVKRIQENNLHKSQIIFNVDLTIKKQEEILSKIISCLKFMPKIMKRYIDINHYNECLEVIGSLIDNAVKLNANSTEKDKRKAKNKHSVVVGGSMISRGFTFEELITCVMINEPTNSKYSADTLLQRCRWFGYRQGFLENSKTEQYKIMKIITTKNIVDCLEEAKLLNDIIISNNDIELIREKIKSLSFRYISPSQKVGKNDKRL